jgi:hypothetical protein
VRSPPPIDHRCAQSHYATIVQAQEDVEIYQLGDLDCAACLRRMVDEHSAIVALFRARLAAVSSGAVAEVAAPLRALCHECSEMVEVVDGKLDPHHGTTGDGCPQNGADAQVYLHPRVAARIMELEAALVFGGAR